jgi:hypothetical protein
MTPQDICTIHPFDSVLQSNECETVARNILVILARTGNVFRLLTWDEYKAQRLIDGHFTEREKLFFHKVVLHCATVENARLFSRYWNIKESLNEQA